MSARIVTSVLVLHDSQLKISFFPLCSVVKCPAVTEPPHGTVFPSRCKSPLGVNYKTDCFFMCNASNSYGLEGPSRVSCLENGSLSADVSQVVCRGMLCGGSVLTFSQLTVSYDVHDGTHRHNLWEESNYPSFELLRSAIFRYLLFLWHLYDLRKRHFNEIKISCFLYIT